MTSNTDKPAKGGKLSNRLDALKSAFDTFTNPNIAHNAKELGVFVGAITGLVSRNLVVGLVTAPTVAVAFDNWQDVKEEEVRARIAAAMDSPSGGNLNTKNGLPNSFGEYGRPDPSSQSGDGGNGSTTRYDFYPFHTGTLIIEAINRGLDYFWSHCNEYQPHNPLGLATSFEYYQNLAKVACLSHRY